MTTKSGLNKLGGVQCLKRDKVWKKSKKLTKNKILIF